MDSFRSVESRENGPCCWQDLFSLPNSSTAPDWDARHGERGERGIEENLPVREDPARGFFVDGLQEFKVRDFEEAVELLNWGLENRRMGRTAMNFTSSRSHTVLTVNVSACATCFLGFFVWRPAVVPAMRRSSNGL